jgi:Protein of unknown function (DUF4230)
MIARLLGYIGKIVLVAVVVTVVLFQYGPQLLGQTVTNGVNGWLTDHATQAPPVAAAVPESLTTVNTTALVTALRALNRWETQGVRVHTCTTVDNTLGGKPWSFFTEQVKEVCADGVVIAGVDLHGFAEQVRVHDGSSVQVRVPASQVFSVTIDPLSYTFDGRKGWLSPDREDAFWQVITTNLYNGMLDGACHQQVTERAAASFETVATELIQAIEPGLTDVRIDGAVGDCRTVVDFAATEGN